MYNCIKVVVDVDKNIVYANRGKSLEYLTEWACSYYKKRDIAVINKIPTPFKIIGRFKNFYFGHYDKKSTVDFEGILKTGQHIAFDCKQTKGNRFSLDNVKQHQFDYLKSIQKLNGLSFLLIEFTDINKYIRLHYTDLDCFWGMQSNKRGTKSITFEALSKFQLTQNTKVTIDFLQGLY
jgi:recombination protein U